MATRTIGNVTLYTEWPPEGIVSPIGQYDTYIEASCYCETEPVNYIGWIHADHRRSCVFHQVCPEMADHPRAYWLSPHHDRYYLPTLLPKSALISKRRDSLKTAPLQLCVVGGTVRRHWSYLTAFFDSPPVPLSSLPDFWIRILSFGSYPQAMENQRNVTLFSKIVDYVDFHRAVSGQCNAMLVLLTKAHHGSYFQSPNNKKKLSGTIPLIVAYQLPFVIHEDLYGFYKEHLPISSVPYLTHSDEPDSFTRALSQLLPKLRSRQA